MFNFKIQGTLTAFGIFVIVVVVMFLILGVDGSQTIIPSFTNSDFSEEVTSEISTTQEEEQNTILISEMNCNELRDFILTFEKGWGKAMAEFGSRCSSDDSN
ncbi:hypothetical protein [Nitrosopumilus sp.]|uniref:hypothetical protein n=1 Tax=Nitrosopumilus sp. TaxID=2024843 RepID=UPI00292E55A7|nr:hypothetical protein [Nitrosopumilus sp.]